MNAITIARTDDLTHQEWLNLRQNGIGGSDAAIAAGLSRWKTPYELWLEKTGQIEPKDPGEKALWGKLLEPVIREEFSRRTGFQVELVNEVLQHPNYPFMIANLDGLVVEPRAIFEAKTTGSYLSHDEIPDEYMLQIQHYLAVTGLHVTYLAVLIRGNKFEWHCIKRDDELISLLIRAEKKFWHYVQTVTPPPLDPSSLTADLLKILYPCGKPGQITLPDKALSFILQYESAQGDKYDALQKEELAANQLKAMLGEYERGVVGDRTVLWKNVRSERLNIKKLQSAHPDIFKEFIETSSYRRFSIK